jgi:RNA polymerase sigma factor (sigma-70 family)
MRACLPGGGRDYTLQWRRVGQPDLETLVERYAALIRSAVGRVAGSRSADIGDDVVQRVTTALWKRLKGEQVIDHPASYIYRCAIREALRELDRLGDALSAPLDEQLADDAPDPETVLQARQLGATIETCFADLHPERAQAVRAHLAGFAVEEIMEMYAWPYQKARNLISRGMADLRARLAQRGIHEA